MKPSNRAIRKLGLNSLLGAGLAMAALPGGSAGAQGLPSVPPVGPGQCVANCNLPSLPTLPPGPVAPVPVAPITVTPPTTIAPTTGAPTIVTPTIPGIQPFDVERTIGTVKTDLETIERSGLRRELDAEKAGNEILFGDRGEKLKRWDPDAWRAAKRGYYDAAEFSYDAILILVEGIPWLIDDFKASLNDKLAWAAQHKPGDFELRELLARTLVKLDPDDANSQERLRKLLLEKWRLEMNERLAGLSDEDLQLELRRATLGLKRMKSDFQRDVAALREWLKESQDAEEKALLVGFKSFANAALKLPGIKKTKDFNLLRLKKIAEYGLKQLDKAEKINDALKNDNPSARQTRLELIRDAYDNMTEIVDKAGSGVLKDIAETVSPLAKFTVDYSFEASRWVVARGQINTIIDNLDKPNGKLDAQLALTRVHKALTQEHVRRGQGVIEAPLPAATPSG